MSKFSFQEAVCGKNRTYALTYYSWLCMELANSHRRFMEDFFYFPYALPSETKTLLTEAANVLTEARNLPYRDYETKTQEKFFQSLSHYREILKNDLIDCYYKGRPSAAGKFEAYVEDMTARIERDSRNATWLSNRVQEHFREFAVRPLTFFSMAAVSYRNSNERAPVKESIFYSLAELRDRAFREPTAERVERYLKKVELIRATKEYKRLSYVVKQVSSEDNSEAIRELEDELSVAVLWNQAPTKLKELS